MRIKSLRIRSYKSFKVVEAVVESVALPRLASL